MVCEWGRRSLSALVKSAAGPGGMQAPAPQLPRLPVMAASAGPAQAWLPSEAPEEGGDGECRAREACAATHS